MVPVTDLCVPAVQELCEPRRRLPQSLGRSWACKSIKILVPLSMLFIKIPMGLMYTVAYCRYCLRAAVGEIPSACCVRCRRGRLGSSTGWLRDVVGGVGRWAQPIRGRLTLPIGRLGSCNSLGGRASAWLQQECGARPTGAGPGRVLAGVRWVPRMRPGL